MGYGTVVLDPDPRAPAGRVADEHLVAAYDDPAALDHLAARCAVVTTEFENPPAEALRAAGRRTSRVAPPPAAVAIAQDRLAEKRFLAGLGVPTAPFAVAGEPAPPAIALPGDPQDGPPRLRRQGPARRRRPAATRRGAWRRARRRAVRPRAARVPLDAELSVIVARTADGPAAAFPVAENHHVDGILDLTVVPAACRRAVAAEAVGARRGGSPTPSTTSACWPSRCSSARARCSSTSWRPRPHNSGHWTLDAAVTSQFDQQVRAVCGLALGRPTLTAGGGGDGQPARRPVGRRRAGVGRAPSPSPTRGSTSTARRPPGPAARWATSRCSATTPTPPPPAPLGLPRRGSRHVDADELADGVGHGAGAEHDQHLAERSSGGSSGRPSGR